MAGYDDPNNEGDDEYEYQDHHSDCKIRVGGECDCDGGTNDLFHVLVGKKVGASKDRCDALERPVRTLEREE